MRAMLQTTTAVLALTAICSTALGQSPMPWQPNLETAQRLAGQTNRLVLIHFWAPWCRPCMRLEHEVFSRAETAKGLEANFVLVKLNADEAPGTARLYGVSSLPSDVIITPSGQLVSQVQSPPTASQYVQQMNQAAAGHRSLAQKSATSNVQNTVPDDASAAPAANTGAMHDPYASPPANTAAMNDLHATPPDAGHAGNQAPTADHRYAEYYPPEQATAEAGEQADNRVTPAQAYAAAGAATQRTMVDPYASPAQPQAANPSAQPPGVDPYAAGAATPAPVNSYGAPQTAATSPNPYAAPQAAAAAPAAPLAAQTAAASQYYNPRAPYGPPPENPYSAAPPAAGAPNLYAAAQPVAAQTGGPPSYQPQANLPALPPGCPPLAMEGNCPVTLMERRRWAQGHPSFGVVHRGRTYLFLGPQEREKFLTDPDRYSPVLSGLDPVMLVDSNTPVPGKREFGVFGADGRVYLFANEASRARFEENEQTYAGRTAQLMQPPAQAPMQPPSYQAMR